MDPDLLRNMMLLAELERQRHLLLYRIERQREQRAIDEFLMRHVRHHDHNEVDDFIPRLPDGELDMMGGIGRGTAEPDMPHHMTSGQRTVQQQGSFEQERERQSRGPPAGEADPRGPGNVGPRPFSAVGMDANLYLAHGDVSHFWPDAHQQGFTDNMDADLFRAHERPPDEQQGGGGSGGAGGAGSRTSNMPGPSPFAPHNMDTNPFQAHEAPEPSGSHLPRLP